MVSYRFLRYTICVYFCDDVSGCFYRFVKKWWIDWLIDAASCYRLYRNWSVSVCMCLFVTFVSTAKKRWTDRDAVCDLTRVGPRNRILDGVQIPLGEGQYLRVVRPVEKHGETLLRYTQKRLDRSMPFGVSFFEFAIVFVTRLSHVCSRDCCCCCCWRGFLTMCHTPCSERQR